MVVPSAKFTLAILKHSI